MVRLRPQLASVREAGLAHEMSGSGSGQGYYASLDESISNQELTEARFAAYAVLTRENSEALDGLREGEWGYAKLRYVSEQRLFSWLFEKLALYVQEKLERARQ